MNTNYSGIARRSAWIAALFLWMLPQAWAASVWVEPKWLASHQADKTVVLIDMSDETQYERFHIPGAVHLPYYALLFQTKKDKFARPIDDKRLAFILGKLGVSNDSHVVIYDDMGGLNAGRLFWHLEGIGHKKVSVLNGGLVKWILQGRKVVNTPVKPVAVKYSPIGNGRQNLAVLEDVQKASSDSKTVLLDVRTEEEYIGDLKKRRGGHIPGAHWWPWLDSVDFQGGFVRKPDAQLLKTLQTSGASKDKPVIAYCRSGHRASQTYLTLRGMGFEKVRLYANSMNEYGGKRLPLVLGKSPAK